MDQERRQEEVELLRNALVAANLSENAGEEYGNQEELGVLDALIEALFETAAIDEVEPLLVRYRELAKAETATRDCTRSRASAPRLVNLFILPLHSTKTANV